MAVAASTLPRLPARTAGWLSRLLTVDRPLLRELAYGLGGPYHVVYPQRFDDNATAFMSAMDEYGVTGRVCYAKKANKAACWIGRCAALGIGVDVASVGELRAALAHGVRGEDIVVTGPAKSADLLRLAARHGSLVAVDALDELARYEALGGGRLLLRSLPPGQPHSRFGLDDAELEHAVEVCAHPDSPAHLEGFSFHLSGYQTGPRADLAAQLIRRCERARALGAPADRISIGGGFAVDYVTAEDWRRFQADRRDEHFHTEKRFGDFYPYHSPLAGADALRAILTAPVNGATNLASALRDKGVALLVEPGRALLDQAGATVFTIQGVKQRDYGILTVDGTSLSLSEQWFNSEFLPDPVLVPDAASDDGPFAACVGGATCLESDMLTWRKVYLAQRPAVGDLLVYLNTAGYQMDSNESPFHDVPLPPKVVLDVPDDGFRWRLDHHTPRG